MKKLSIFLVLPLLVLVSCGLPESNDHKDPNIWKERMVDNIGSMNLETGRTFLSIYTQIYIRDDQDQYDLTATVSIHNPNQLDSVYIDRAVFFNTEGVAIRTYFTYPIFIRPMETLQIVIPVLDNEGGTGANFIFDWEKKASLYDPIFEAIMVSSQGNHGISFVTEGKRLH